MRGKRLPLLSVITVVALVTVAIPGYATQVQTAQNRVPQQVVINGQTVNAVSVVAEGGGLQTYRCLNPQQYSSLDGASQGWACYDQATGVWLLNALPPAQAQVPPPVQPPVQQPPVQRAPLPVPQPQAAPPVYPQQPSVVYQQPPVVVYQQPPIVYQPATVVYQQPAVFYPAPVVYTTPVYPRPVVVAPAYPSSVVLGAAAIGAAGRIISAAVYGHPHVTYVAPYYRGGRVWRR